MPTIIKPVDYLLCEGSSDAQFLSLYVERQFSYSEDFDKARTYSPVVSGGSYHYMVGSARDLLICSCAGCDNIDFVYENVVLPQIKNYNMNARVMVVIDRDIKTDTDCLSKIQLNEISLLINNWKTDFVNGDYIEPDGNYHQIKCKTYFCVVPASSNGAFENVLMNAIATTEPDIVNEVNNFYNNITSNAGRHITKNRLNIKARLDTMLVMIDPEKIYLTLKQLFSLIDVNDSNIVSNFSFLGDIVNLV